jgi:hypothetical protein
VFTRFAAHQGSNLLSRRQENRAPPCDLPTVYITSRASAGEWCHAARSPKPSSPAARSLAVCQSTYHAL